MVITEKTIAGSWYTISCTAACSVTEVVGDGVSHLVTLDDAGQEHFRAAGAEVTIETDGSYVLYPFD